MKNNIGSKILASAQEKLKKQGSARPDLALADYRMIDATHADILVAYAKSVPNNAELSTFVTASFKGKAFPIFETARVYDLQKVVGITIVPPQITRPLADKDKMMKITASTFLDVNDSSEWGLATNASTGVQYLARSMEEDFEGIIKARKARLGSNSAVTASSNFSAVTASYLTANEDDFVKFFDGNGIRTGTIKQVMPDNNTLKIMDDEGELYVVRRESVTQIIRKDPDEVKKITDDMQEFYSKIWGPGFAADLMKNGPTV